MLVGGERKQEMLQRGIFMPALAGLGQCVVQGLFQLSGKRWHSVHSDGSEGSRTAIQYIGSRTSGIKNSGAARLKGSRSEEHTSELQSLMRISYAVFCLKKKQHKLNQAEKT